VVITQNVFASPTISRNLFVNNIVRDNPCRAFNFTVPVDGAPQPRMGDTVNSSGIADQTGAAGNLSANPLFADSATSVFQLAPGSPALGAGSQLSAPTDDFDGLTRGSSIDIGALARSTIARHTSFNCTIRSRAFGSRAIGKYVAAELCDPSPINAVVHARPRSCTTRAPKRVCCGHARRNRSRARPL
jgi:hypothetical protein